jgi:hypothetical protein
MLRNSSILRRALLARGREVNGVAIRSFHCTGLYSADALAMTDTFSRRHGESIFQPWMLIRTNVFHGTRTSFHS